MQIRTLFLFLLFESAFAQEMWTWNSTVNRGCFGWPCDNVTYSPDRGEWDQVIEVFLMNFHESVVGIRCEAHKDFAELTINNCTHIRVGKGNTFPVGPSATLLLPGTVCTFDAFYFE